MTKRKNPPTAGKAIQLDMQPLADIDLLPDAWERFERAVDQVAKSPPQHRTKPPTPKPRKASKPIK